MLTCGLCACGGGGDGGGGGTVSVTPPVEVDPKTRAENETIETLWVSHHHYWDPNDLPAPSMSLIVSPAVAPDFSLEHMQLIPSVTGFTYEPGYVYRIRVKKTKVIHLADLPIYTYTWLATEQKQLATGQVFDFEFQKTTNYRRTGTSIKPLNLPLEFTCDLTLCDAIDAQLSRPEVTSLILAARVQLPGQPIYFTAIKSVVDQAH
ncbi:MAG TPA: DUF4377 domain-containing protein [Cellvibrionaceae bacterium]|nr:DUF4377 domain-containing protein [Cellvibrionaceae bacterium]